MVRKQLYYNDKVFTDVKDLVKNLDIKDVKAIFRKNKEILILNHNTNFYTLNLPNSFQKLDTYFCDHCSLIFEKSNLECVKNKHYCKSCIEKGKRCSVCGCITFYERKVYINENAYMYYCPDCYYEDNVKRCKNCHKYYTDSDNDNLCHACQKDFVYCRNCDTVYEKNLIEFKDNMCTNCYVRKKKKESLHSYSYKPKACFKKDKSEDDEHKEFMGIELEFENEDYISDDERLNTTFKLAEKYEDFMYIKTDGSLSYGLEIVTHPISLTSWLNEYLEKLKDIINILNADGYYSDTKNCGLHIHFSKKALGFNEKDTKCTIIKLVTLFSRLQNKGFLIKFSRRLLEKFEKWANFYKLEKLNILSNVNLSDDDVCDEIFYLLKEESRYRIINIQNKNTIEFRLFKGTDDIEDIKASLILIYNCVAYCIRNDFKTVYDTSIVDILSKGYYKNYMLNYLERKELM